MYIVCIVNVSMNESAVMLTAYPVNSMEGELVVTVLLPNTAAREMTAARATSRGGNGLEAYRSPTIVIDTHAPTKDTCTYT